jgi:hypothetical protein
MGMVILLVPFPQYTDYTCLGIGLKTGTQNFRIFKIFGIKDVKYSC